MSKCLKCGAKIKSIPGRRPKQFCNSNCRSMHWQKERAKINKENREIVLGYKKQENVPRETENIILKLHKLKQETCPEERDTILGRRIWREEQDEKIRDLEAQLGLPS